MLKFVRLSIAVSLISQPCWPGMVASAKLTAVPVYTPKASRDLTGVWEGTVGDQQVMACFDGDIGSYYRVQDKQSIWLWAESSLQFAEKDERNPRNPRWRVRLQASGQVIGQRVEGGSQQPLELRRLSIPEAAADEAGCSSIVYLGKRIEPLSVSEEPFNVGSINLTRLIARPPHNRDDYEYRTFRLPDVDPGSKALNNRLASFIDLRGPGESGWSECLLGAGNTGGTFYEMLEPTRIGRRFITANEHRELSCGGTHPDSSNYPRIFDRSSGKEIEIISWLLPRALDQKTLKLIGPIDFDDEPNTLPLSAALAKQVLKHADRLKMKDCSDVSTDFWSVGVSRRGFVFTPSLGHAVQACGDDVTLPFETLSPFLNAKGKRAVQILRSEPAQYARWP